MRSVAWMFVFPYNYNFLCIHLDRMAHRSIECVYSIIYMYLSMCAIIAGVVSLVTLHEHNWCPTWHYKSQGNLRSHPQPTLFLLSCNRLARIPKSQDCSWSISAVSAETFKSRLHQNSSWETWYHSQCGRLMHAFDDCDGLDRLSIGM